MEQRRHPGDSFDTRTVFRAAAPRLPIPNADIRVQIVLFHTVFAPRNIFVNEDTGEITGVLDWDRAESVPAKAAWTTPTWLFLGEETRYQISSMLSEEPAYTRSLDICATRVAFT